MTLTAEHGSNLYDYLFLGSLVIECNEHVYSDLANTLYYSDYRTRRLAIIECNGLKIPVTIASVNEQKIKLFFGLYNNRRRTGMGFSHYTSQTIFGEEVEQNLW